MKRLSAVLAATTLVTSVGAFADVLRNDASPFAVNVPNVRSGFEINIEGLFLRPSNSDLDYGFTVLDDGVHNAQANMLTVKPDMKFGWGVGIGYVFPDSGNDVQLNWTEFNHSNSNSFSYTEQGDPSAPAGYTLFTPFGNDIDLNNPDSDFAAGNNSDITSASSQAKFKLSVVDLDAGQYVDVGDRLQLRALAGLRFARVENNLTNQYDAVDPTDSDIILTENDTFHSKFNGIGPLLGVDANYNLGGGVSAAAHVATTLLVGKVDADSNYFSDDESGDYFSGTAQIDSDDVWRVVPAFDAKLGLNYSYTFQCDSVVTLEGGYKVTQYLDAVDRLDGLFNGNNSDPIKVTRTTSSLGLSGPYLKLSFKF